MKKRVITILLLFFVSGTIYAQRFQVDTLQYNGDKSRCINAVIMGDGYTEREQESFIRTAKELKDAFFREPPFSRYHNYFNFFAIRVISPESGISHPGTSSDCPRNEDGSHVVPIGKVNNFFNTSFDSYEIHRIVFALDEKKVSKVLTDNIPEYDIVTIIANSTHDGGAGGWFATITADDYSREVFLHELGHIFADLADEYNAGDRYFFEKSNMTMEKDPLKIKWKNWLSYKKVGIYQYAAGHDHSTLHTKWYKPHRDCKMERLDESFCPVCTEALVLKIQNNVNPIVRYSPCVASNKKGRGAPEEFIDADDKMLDFKLMDLIKPYPNTLKTTWTLNKVDIFNNVDSITIDRASLPLGVSRVTVSVIDTTNLVRVDFPSRKVNTVTWNITKTSTTAVDLISSKENEIRYLVFPDPSGNLLNVSVHLDKREKVEMQIFSLDGETVHASRGYSGTNGEYAKSINIGNYPKGIYIVVFKIGGVVHSQKFIKQ